MNQKGSLLIWIVLFFVLVVGIVGGSFYLKSLKNSNLTIQPTPFNSQMPSANPSINSETSWKSWDSQEPAFSLKLPSNWQAQHSTKNCLAENCLAINGTEGEVVIKWGSGFGGGCDQQDTQNVQVNNQTIPSCHGLNSDGSETWGTINLSARGISFNLTAKANYPSSNNRDIILKVLSTFKLN